MFIYLFSELAGGRAEHKVDSGMREWKEASTSFKNKKSQFKNSRGLS